MGTRPTAHTGLLTVFCQHTSASLVIQENADPDVVADLNDFFTRLVPEDTRLYRHTAEGPDDMTSHIRSALTSTQLSIPIHQGRTGAGNLAGDLSVRASRASAQAQRGIAPADGLTMRRAGRWTVRALAALGLLIVLVTVTPIEGWWIQWLAGPWNDPKGDVLVVLGAGSVRDVIDWSSYWRSVYAVRAWREGGFREVVVTGGSLRGETPAAERMRDFMVSQGVPASAILVEGESAQHARERAEIESAAGPTARPQSADDERLPHVSRNSRVPQGRHRYRTPAAAGRRQANQLLAEPLAGVLGAVFGDGEDRILLRARLDLGSIPYRTATARERYVCSCRGSASLRSRFG